MSVGLICEFNPFHYGHKYIIDKAHEFTNEPVVCIMSGPFVQRAEPACASKYSRAKAALLYGADAVIELPVKFATAAAKNFARGGVEILKNISGVTSLAFGVETDNPEILFRIAEIKRLPQTDQLIKEQLALGLSYPTAVANAIAKISDNNLSFINTLNGPNNILALEYIDALQGTNISPLPIKRVGSDYNDKNINGTFASATALRESISQGKDDLDIYLPQVMLKECLSVAPDMNIFSTLTLYALRRMSLDQIRQLPDVEPGLEYSIQKAIQLSSIAAAIEQIKSKRYTYARLKRIFLHALLGIDKHIMSDITNAKTRILGIKKEFKPFLSNLNSNIIARNSDATDEFTSDKSVIVDAFAQDVYALLTGSEANAYYKEPLIIV